jgi:hypothetical protein
MAGPWRPRQRRGCRGVSHDGAVASRAGIIRHAVRLVEFLAPSCVHASLARLRTRPAAPLPRTHTQIAFVHQCRQEAGVREYFA